ncbi:HD family phosphohydrolase [Calothrix rhizosoleniae]|uniref:HD family phosphohydrolase n=1 Tax=Calothrix rhizosoleniae TaxID=888997 RepID=UPI00190E7941|nr:HDIG domain-containing metalloprotein [Calothrix rhizosoleniae]
MKTKSPINLSLGSIKIHYPVVFTLSVVSLTGVMGHKLYNQPKLKPQTIAPQTIIAPKNGLIEDLEQTKNKRQAASQSSLPVLMVDTSVNKQIDQKLQQLLSQINRLRTTAGSLPFVNPSILSLASQVYLRSSNDREWEKLQAAVEYYSKEKSKGLTGKSSRINQLQTKPQNKYISNGSSEFDQIVAEIAAYRLKTSAQNLSGLFSEISTARQGYIQARTQLSQIVDTQKQSIFKQSNILDISDDDWQKTQMGIEDITERILAQGISPGLPENVLPDVVRLNVQASVPKNGQNIATIILLKIIQPNLLKDEVKTKLRAQQAAADIQPILVNVKKGDVIVHKGTTITPWQFTVLEYYRLSRREINWLGLTFLTGAVIGGIGVFILVQRRIKRRLRQRDCLLFLLLTLSVPLVLRFGIPYATWSGIGLLLGSFYGSTLGVTVIGLLLLIVPIGLEVSKTALIAGAAGGILGSCVAQRLHSREELALLGIAIALTQAGVYLVIQLLLGGVPFSAASYLILQKAVLFGLSGLIWSIVALGLSPYLEKIFDLITPIRLAELANPNRSLLQQLATKTPGTFQHTLFVSTLAEAAAKKLGCNVELVRAGTLYHDIGKMHDPQAFIENQMGGPNKHDTEIKDPWKSAEIIKKHVSQGLVMARKHSLPMAIQAFIPEHQGTMQIAYFYHQAEQIAKEDPNFIVEESSFRYQGPIPQSRETGIVMLADSCEAALRSLKDATPEKALTMVNNILRARWQDNQLVDSGLKREEITEIAHIFVQVWQQFHHKRIAYPKLKATVHKGKE